MTRDFLDDRIRKDLNRRSGALFLAVLTVLSAAVFFGAALLQRYAGIDDFTGTKQEEFIRLTSIVYTAVFLLTFLLQWGPLKKLPALYAIGFAGISGLIILAKISLLDYVSDDYEIFLSNWIYEYSSMGLKQGLGTYIGSDYSPPYLYFLWFISRVKNFPWFYLVKSISVAFDALLGFAIMKLVSLQDERPAVQLGAFALAMMLPTVVFNGAYWSQCDVIYSSLSLLALYNAVKRRDIASMLLFGVALSFKLQTVFFLPALLPLWLRKDIRLRTLPLIPAGYMGMMIPALWGGKSLHHVLTVYLQQAGAYGFITVNGPTLYELFIPGKDEKGTFYLMFGNMALFLAFGFMVAVCILLCMNKERVTKDVVLLSALVFLAGVPFFLPKIHERYTFGADVLALAVAFRKPRRRVLLPVCFGFASYVCYTAGLAGEKILPQNIASLFQLAGIALALYELWRVLQPDAMRVEERKA